MQKRLVWILAPLMLSLLLACPPKIRGGGSDEHSAMAKQNGVLLAKVGDTVITVEEMEKKLNQQSPFIRSRYADIDKRREYLDNQIRFELLAQEAERRGLDRDPNIRDSLKKIMVQKLTRDEFDNRVKLDDITDGEIQAYYAEHKDDYHKPEMVRVSHILFAFGDAKAAAKKQAEATLRELKAKPDDRLLFRQLAKERSADEASKNSGGDLRYLSRKQYVERFGETEAKAVFELQRLNALTAVIESSDGYHIFKQTGRRQAIDRTIDQVRTQIRNRLYRDKRTQAFNSFIDDLRGRAGVRIDEAKLASLQIIGVTPKATPKAVPRPHVAQPAASSQPHAP